MTTYAEAKFYEKHLKRFLKRLYVYTDTKRPLVYMDETGFMPEAWRDYGWSPVGQRVYGEKPSGKRPRTGLIGGWKEGEFLAPFLFNGTCTIKLFNYWLEHHLIPELAANSVIIMDNATFHKSRTSLDMIRAAGHTVLFLPPYSPHLNKIEKLWANIKRKWKYLSHLTLDELIKSFF